MSALVSRSYPHRVSPLNALKIPFALKDGRMVGPRQVEAGLACGCSCPCCGAPVMARAQDSTDRRPHFAHHGRRGCSGGAETALHRMAKQLIADHLQLQLPAWDGGREMPNPPTRTNALGERVVGVKVEIPARLAQLRSVSVEDRGVAGDYRPDLMVHDDEGALLVEIRVSHAVGALKQRRVQADGHRMLEIDLSGLSLATLDTAELTRAVLYSPTNRRWLSHPAASEAWRTSLRNLKALVEAMDRGIAAGRRSAPAEARALDLRPRMRAQLAPRLAWLARWAAPEARGERLQALEGRDGAQAAEALRQLPGALRSAVLCPHPADDAFSAAPALWKALVVSERILPMRRGTAVEVRALTEWVRNRFGVPAVLWHLHVARLSSDWDRVAAGWRPHAWFLTDAENAALPDPEGAVGALLARVAAEGCLRALRGKPGVYRRT